MLMFYEIFIIFAFGLIIGSFLNVIILRTYKGKSILGRSQCPKCKRQISWYDNIPLLSFIVLGGRCRQCRQKISWQYPMVELAAGLLFVLAFLSVNSSQLIIHNYSLLTAYSLRLTALLVFIGVLVVIFVQDWRWYVILDIITLPAILGAFIINIILEMSWQNLIFGGIIGSGFFLIQFLISRGKWIGGGDIRLGALMGVMLGWPMVLVALFLAYLLGAAVSIFLLLARKKKMADKLPFGTFLSAATVITLFWGQQILVWYLGFIF